MIHFDTPFPSWAYLLPVICCFCYGLMLLFRRESRSKQMLGVVMLFASICFCASLANDSMAQQGGRVPVVNNWHFVSVLLMWPTVGWYLTLLSRPDAKFFPHYFRHYYPFFIAGAGTLLFMLFAPPTPVVYSMKDYVALLGKYPEAIYRTIVIVVYIFQTIYFVRRTELQLRAHRERIRNDFSYTAKVDLQWVRIIATIVVICCFLNFIYAFTASIHHRMILSIVMFVFIIPQCILGATHKDVYYFPKPVDVPSQNFSLPLQASLFVSPGQEKSKINPLMYEKIRDGLTDLLERQEVYCNPDLRIDDLAEMLHTNKTNVSQVINESFHTNFYALINHYRVKKALTLLGDRQMQVKDVWTQSGFHSQSVFNAVFKKEMQLTPSEWVKNIEH